MGGRGPTRRQFLGALGAGCSLGLTGCSDARRSVGLAPNIDEESNERSIDFATQIASDLMVWRRERIEMSRLLAQSDALQNGTVAERNTWPYQ
jgi:hypothetical protein